MFKNRRTSLVSKFIIPTILIFVILMSTTGIITYVEMSKTLNNQMQAFAQNNLQALALTLNENNETYNLIKDQLYKDLISKSKALAEIIAANPSVLTNEKLIALAKSLDVQEIHVTDGKGVIAYGTVPEFIGFDFNTSDQTKPFLNGLTDKSFELAQEPSPRGTDKTLFQYVGVARQDMPGIVQIGVEPKTISAMLDKMALSTIISQTKVGNGGYAAATDFNGNIIAHPKKELLGKNLKDLGINIDLGKNQGETKYTLNGEAKYLQYQKMDNDIVFIVIPQTQFLGPLYSMISVLTLVEIILLALSVVALLLISRFTIVTKLKEIVRLIDKTAAFDLSYDSSFEPLLKLKDEIGLIANSAAKMRKTLREIIGSIRSESDHILDNSQSLSSATNESAAASEEVAKTVEELANGASEQAKEAQNVSEKLIALSNEIDTVAEKSTSIEDGAHKIEELNGLGKKAIDDLKEIFAENTSVSLKVSEDIQELSNKSGSVSSIVETIQNIASQTNLLALNAAIEAARAGEAGKGFAVVADEIRKLAESTTVSTKEINDIVSQIQTDIQETKVNMDRAGALVGKTNDEVKETEKSFIVMSEAVKKAIEDISVLNQSMKKVNESKNSVVVSVEEISAISEESAAATEEVSASVEEQSSTIEDISATAENLKDIAVKLSDIVKGFKI